MALGATWVAGFVDATGWMLLSHIYTSNMTGNTIQMTLHWTDRNWSGVLQRGWPIAMFVAGLILAGIATEACVRRGLNSFSAINLGTEALLIACFIPLAAPALHNGEIQAGSFWHFNFLVALLAVAMGIQNQTVTKIGSLSFRTTHVTGILAHLGAAVVEYFFWAYDRLRSKTASPAAFVRESLHRTEFRRLSLHAGLWVAFAIGAIAAVLSHRRWGVLGLAAPVSLLVVMVLIDLIRPIAASAEAQQMRKESTDGRTSFAA